MYNSDADHDYVIGSNVYGLFPPAIGNVVLKGAVAPSGDLLDNDNDSIIDEPGVQCLMNGFNYHMSQNWQFPQWHLTNPYRYHNYMEGRWYDSTNFTCGGNAYGGTTPTRYVYPWMNYQNNPFTSNWTELNAGNLPGDRRYLVSSGPFNLPSKGQTEFEVALVWSVDSAATSNRNIASVNKLIQDARKVKSFYSGAIPNCLQKVNIKENESMKHLIDLYPNPGLAHALPRRHRLRLALTQNVQRRGGEGHTLVGADLALAHALDAAAANRQLRAGGSQACQGERDGGAEGSQRVHVSALRGGTVRRAGARQRRRAWAMA